MTAAASTGGDRSSTRLLIDLGNSRLKWVLADGSRFIAPAEALTPGPRNYPWQAWQAAAPGEIAMACVAPVETGAALVRQLEARLGIAVREARVEAEWRGLRCAYREPARFGVDRWLAMLAVHDAAPHRPALIVSAGTALTVDRLDPGGLHRGGVIAPGLAAMRDGLFAAAPGLAAFVDGEAGGGMAVDSADAIASGCLQAGAGLVWQALQAMKDEGPAPGLWLSGGDAEALAALLSGDIRLRPWLVLEGLAIWAYRSTQVGPPAVD